MSSLTADPIMDTPSARLRNTEDAKLLRVTDGLGVERSVHLYFGGLPRTEFGYEGPQGFLAHLLPDDTVHSHFHQIDQFQVLFGAPGARYQRSEIAPDEVVVHYTDAYSVYGPIIAGPGGMDFFTLRQVGHSFTGYMPAAREELTRRGRRNVHERFRASTAGLRDGEHSDAVLIADDADHLRVSLLTAGPRSEFRGPDASHGSGQYYCVAAGTVLDEADDRFDRKSLAWIARGGNPPTLRTGTEGCQILVLQFPYPATGPDS